MIWERQAGFQEYLEWAAQHPDDASRRGSIYHSPIGGIFAYERWYESGTPIEQIAAQIISMAIRGHHGGLLDCVAPDGRSIYMDRIHQDKHRLFYHQAVSNFLAEVASEAELDRLFKGACREVQALLRRVENKDRAFVQGMLARLLLSCVVDADRWDTACFDKDEDPSRQSAHLQTWRKI